jgi:mRNA interferase YafQ
MRTIRRTARFKKDYKREAKGRHRDSLDADFREILELLAADRAMPARFRDHALGGQWRDFRDCHIHPDLVLIYRKPDGHYLDLVRLGSHSELGM